jgi:formylglycine-generating enzyme required for sulfatase activity
MLPDKYQWIVQQFEPEGDPRLLLEIAARLEEDGNLEGAATVYDRAFGLDPADAEVRAGRSRVLDELSVTEHDVHFRYVPGGSFLMGSPEGEQDERPWHPVWLAPFWMAETPVSWDSYCRLMDWEPPPNGHPRDYEERWEDYSDSGLAPFNAARIQLQYCEDKTTRAVDWHSHMPGQRWNQGGEVRTSQELFGAPPRSEPEAPWRYDTKPMVAVSFEAAAALVERLSTSAVPYALPTEAQWEKAARGGLIGAHYAWGNEPPSRANCDFGRFHEFSVRPMKTFPPNAYGLYAVCGGVWEWTRDWYDAAFYGHSPMTDPEGPPKGQERVARGGSWADCAEAVTVSYRMSFTLNGRRRQEGVRGESTPNVGFRLCRMAAAKP